jgi:hypothetical protein
VVEYQGDPAWIIMSTTMTGNGKQTTHRNGADLGMVYEFGFTTLLLRTLIVDS